MRLIYDGSDGAEVTVEKIRFRAGMVTADLPARLVEKFIAMPHLKIRLATFSEIAAADGVKSAKAPAAKVAPLPKKANPDRPATKAVEEIEE